VHWRAASIYRWQLDDAAHFWSVLFSQIRMTPSCFTTQPCPCTASSRIGSAEPRTLLASGHSASSQQATRSRRRQPREA
jgi:hypothetical protein